MRWHPFEALEPRIHLAVLAEATTIIPGVRGYRTQYADFNDDGIVDAIGSLSNGWTVDFGRADGSFQPSSAAPVIGRPKKLNADDVVLGRWTPGDDSIDIAIIRRIDRKWSVRLFSNDGYGGFTRHAPQLLTGSNLDLYRSTTAEARRGPAEASELLWGYSQTLRSLRFDASGAIVSDSIISTGVRHWYHADFDLDGDDDLLVSRTLGASNGFATIQVAERGDDDSWSFTTLVEGFNAQREYYAGDLDGDDRPDVGWARGRNVTILRNTTQPGDADISFAPPAAFITVEPDAPAGDGYFTYADRSIIVDASRFDVGQPPAVIVQTYTYTFARIPYETLSNVLLRPQSDDSNRTWLIDALSQSTGYFNDLNRYEAERFIDLGGDDLVDLVDARAARRNVAQDNIHRPVVGRLTVAPFNPATGTRSLVASELTDPDGSVQWIEFFHDTDGDGQWSHSDRRIHGRTSRSADGSERRVVLDLDYVYGAAGSQQRFFVRAWDDKGFVGEPVSTDLVITGATPPEPATPSAVPELTAPPAQVVSTTGAVLPIATADFTGDGRPDILRFQRNTSTRTQQLFLLVGRPPRASHPDELRFAAPRLVADNDVVHGINPARVITGRFTSGSELDIVFTRSRPRDFAYELVVLINNGDGRFTVAPDKALNRYFTVATPFSTDGASARQSFIAYTWRGEYVSLRLNDAGRVTRERIVIPNFRGGSLYQPSGSPNIQAADFNGDGRDELVVVRSIYGGASANSVHLYASLPRGGFSISPLTTIRTPWFNSFRLGDVDGDGTPDLVVAGSHYDTTTGVVGEAWIQVHRITMVTGQAQVVEAREIFRDRYDADDVLEEEINILGIGDATGDGVADITIELLNGSSTDANLRAIVIETPWSTQSQPPRPQTILHAGSPAGVYVDIGVVFSMADADGDGVLDLFRRDQVLELYRTV